MEVILLEKVANLGNLGDKVKVKSGFGRNFLVPYGKAVPATADNLKDFEARRSELEKAAADALTRATARAAELEGKEILITAKAGDEGKLFGSVGARDIALAVSEQLSEVSKSEVCLPDGVLRQTGEFDIDFQLHSDVTVSIKVVVKPE